ncbi:AAA family ATPase, partial [Patescibacteria group bacterium]
NKIAEEVLTNKTGSHKSTLKKFPDPFLPYQKLFSELLPGKLLESIDPEQLKEFHYRIVDDPENPLLPFSTLSSGEKEVVKIAFDLLWKKINHSIFLIDEPELHLHPTLTFRLIETLKKMGDGTNQFIFFTHSADLISTYYSTGNVYFIDTTTKKGNQAHKLSDLREKHPDLVELMSENIGLFAVGKKLVFVEGEDASLDRLTYHSIAQQTYPKLNFIPVGSVENVMLLENTTKQLNNSLFGIDFYMIRDRDGLSESKIKQLETGTKLKCIKRRHLENYFLDSKILAKVSNRLCLEKKWSNQANIDKELEQITKTTFTEALSLIIKEYIKINSNIPVPSIKAVQEKNAEELIVEVISQIQVQTKKIGEDLDKSNLESIFNKFKQKLEKSLSDGTWIKVFPGKVLFREICKKIGANCDQVRECYIQIVLEDEEKIFNDIKTIFKAFSAT